MGLYIIENCERYGKVIVMFFYIFLCDVINDFEFLLFELVFFFLLV